MYVDKKYRGKGLGKSMLLNLEKEATPRGAVQLILETTDKMKAAINPYLSCGYTITSTCTESLPCSISMMKILK